MISVRACASFAGLAGNEICLGASPGAKHRALQSRYLLGLWRGSKAVPDFIGADIRRWTEIGARDRAADALLVLRQFLSDFPQARLALALASRPTLRARPRDAGRRRGRSLAGRRVKLSLAQPSLSSEPISPDEEPRSEMRETATRPPVPWRES